MKNRNSSGTRVVMAVCNAATIDTRVVKAAEAVQRAGYDCHVVGIWLRGFKEHEVVNGVHYHRVFLTRVGLFATVRELLSPLDPMEQPYRVPPPVVRPPFMEETETYDILARLTLKRIKNIPRAILNIARAALQMALNMVLPILAKLTFVRVILSRKTQMEYCFSFYPKLVELDGQIYHAHELWMLEGCARAAATMKAGLIYDSHELERHRNIGSVYYEKTTWAECETRYIAHADAVIAVSDGCARQLEKIYSLNNVITLMNIPLAASRSDSGFNLRASLKLSDSKPLVVYVGSVTLNRGVEKVLEALKELPGYFFATVGPWNAATRKKLLELASLYGLKDRFVMHEKVAATEVVNFISTANVSVMPIQNACLSYYFCMPNKLFESALAGVPVVASNFPDLRNFIFENDIGVVCDEKDPHSIAQGIRKVYETRAGFYTQQKIEQLREKYCFEKESEKLLEVYKTVIL